MIYSQRNTFKIRLANTFVYMIALKWNVNGGFTFFRFIYT